LHPLKQDSLESGRLIHRQRQQRHPQHPQRPPAAEQVVLVAVEVAVVAADVEAVVVVFNSILRLRGQNLPAHLAKAALLVIR
jgi:hypothetical protein